MSVGTREEPFGVHQTGSDTLGSNQSVAFGDSPSIDAFARLRVSNPVTLFDSKQIFDNQPLFWDDQEVSGSGTTSTHSVDAARTRLGVGASTAGKRVRQTFQRFNYQPGKSQMIIMTGVLGVAESGITQRIGMFDDDNGLIFSCIDAGMYVTRRSKASGTSVDVDVAQADWNIDKMDGTGASGVAMDFTKTNIFFIDFEWLGVGRVRMGFVIDGVPVYCHEFLNANQLDVVYMSTPNLPLRYSIENDGTAGASTLDHICSTVISEGGSDDLGVLRYGSTDGDHVDANTQDTIYAVLGIRLKTGYLGASVKLLQIGMISETNDDFEWMVYLNPTIAGTFTYADETNSAVQLARGATANTVTPGTSLAGGFASTDTLSIQSALKNARLLGAAIDGTRDEIVVCVRPLSNGADIQAGLTWRELQ